MLLPACCCSPLLPMPPEPLLAGDRVEYHSQPLGIVVAHTQVGEAGVHTRMVWFIAVWRRTSVGRCGVQGLLASPPLHQLASPPPPPPKLLPAVALLCCPVRPPQCKAPRLWP